MSDVTDVQWSKDDPYECYPLSNEVIVIKKVEV